MKWTAPNAARADNLLVRLYRLARRQQENFTTEALAHVLRHLGAHHAEATSRVLEWLTSGELLVGRPAGAPIGIRTQAWTPDLGIPDIRIEGDDLLIIVEVKLGGVPSEAQRAAYLHQLAESNRARKALVALVGHGTPERLDDGTFVRRWGDLAEFLDREAESSGSPVTGYLVGELKTLLFHLDLMPPVVRSGVSAGLARHREWARDNPTALSVLRKRLRSLKAVGGMEGCGPLHDLLAQMRHVLSRSPGVKKSWFDSGPNMARPWIGFNVNDMRYFFFLSLSNPERVVLQRFWNGVDPDSFDGALGELDATHSDGIVRWRHTLDLADPTLSFFEAGSTEQREILTQFFEESFRYAERLPPQPVTVAAGDV
jgi:hypothetical protein